MNASPAAPLPAAVAAATGADLVGRWEPSTSPRPECDHPFLVLRDDVTWRGQDHAEALQGRWVSGPAGLALGTDPPDRGTSCEGATERSRVAPWMLRLARWGIDDGALVLFDAEGGELTRLTRHDPPAADDGDGLSDASGDSSVDRPAAPEEPADRDPRRRGVRVPGGVRYLAATWEHQIDLSPARTQSPYDTSWGDHRILGVARSGRTAKLLTGCYGGDVELTVRARRTPPPPLARALRGWEVGEEEDVTIGSPLYASEPDGAGYRQVFAPAEPGPHRIRVLTRGRNADRGNVCAKVVEHYDVTIWPVDADRPRVRRGDDGV